MGSNSTQGGTKNLNLSAEKLMLGLNGPTFIYIYKYVVRAGKFGSKIT